MLTDAKCRNAVCPPDKKQARFADSGGMYLQVSPLLNLQVIFFKHLPY